MSLTHQLSGTAFEPVSAIPLDDRGFRYGMAVFETIAILGGRPIFPDEHLELLAAAAAAAAFNPPSAWRDAATEHLSTPPVSEGVVRLYVTAGDGAPTDPITAPRIFSIAEALPTVSALPPAACRVVPFTPTTLPVVKTSCYWPHVAALAAARAANFDDAILATPAGRMISGSMSNVFFLLDDDQIVTPPIADGARPGTVRQWILRHFPVREASVIAEDLPRVRAACLSNSRIGVRGVSRINERPLDPAAATAFTKIAALYRREVLRGS